MGNYRRVRIPGGTYFFTVVTRHRKPVFRSPENIEALRHAFRTVRERRPFVVEAIVVLPDHLHCIWRLPESDADYSGRWREIKKLASRVLAPPSDERRERGLWQRRFWEHTIRDEHDWRVHMDYVHYNPVKHGLARRPCDWPWSSFARWVDRGWYEPDWGESEPSDIAGAEWE
ncbi:MAG TPA: transposase [Gammaproteobacteria bacterium]|nr:transposase [Gammaproteobacteria bacterium]